MQLFMLIAESIVPLGVGRSRLVYGQAILWLVIFFHFFLMCSCEFFVRVNVIERYLLMVILPVLK